MNNLFSINFKKSLSISRLNLRRMLVVPIVMLALFVIEDTLGIIQSLTLKNVDENSTIAGIDMLMLCCLFFSIFLATSSFYKTMRLGVKKKDYFWSALITMLMTAFVIAFLCMISFYAFYTPLTKMDKMEWWPLFDIFGFSKNGFFVGFFQMFGFLFFVSVFIFLLSSLQDRWMGWTIDVLIVACISVFASLRVGRKYFWIPFFKALIFGHPALQLSFTIIGGLILYFVYLPILKSKKI